MEECCGGQQCKGDFLTPNGKKFLLKKEEKIRAELAKIHGNTGSGKEDKEKNQSYVETIRNLEKRLGEVKKLLLLPVRKIVEQNSFVSHGNGVKLKFDDEMHTTYVLIDGVCVCKHSLPDKHSIVGANSPLGKALIGKSVNETGNYFVGKKEIKFYIEKIDMPSKAHWLFKYDQPINPEFGADIHLVEKKVELSA